MASFASNRFFLFLAALFFICESPLAAGNLATDSLLVKEIADSLKSGIHFFPIKVEGGRIGRLDIYYGQQTGAIPAALGGLDSLRRLFVSITTVTSLPPEIGKLKRMDSIDITASRVGPSIPAEIGGLSNLRYLRVSGCKLTSLPASLMQLRKLESVDFSRNAICSVEGSLKQWILAISPTALDEQNLVGCGPTPIPSRKPGKGAVKPNTGHAAPDKLDDWSRGFEWEGKGGYFSVLGKWFPLQLQSGRF